MFSFGSDYSVIIGEGHSMDLENGPSEWSPESSLDMLWVCQGGLTSVIGMEWTGKSDTISEFKDIID